MRCLVFVGPHIGCRLCEYRNSILSRLYKDAHHPPAAHSGRLSSFFTRAVQKNSCSASGNLQHFNSKRMCSFSYALLTPMHKAVTKRSLPCRGSTSLSAVATWRACPSSCTRTACCKGRRFHCPQARHRPSAPQVHCRAAFDHLCQPV